MQLRCLRPLNLRNGENKEKKKKPNFLDNVFRYRRDCVEGKKGNCEKEAAVTLETSNMRADAESKRIQAADPKEFEGLERCGFFDDGADRTPEELINHTDCFSRVLCGDAVTNFLQCAEKNNGEYDSIQCREQGLVLARCLGSKVSDAVLKAQFL